MTNRLLLDTCAMIWMAREEWMEPAALAAIDQAFVDEQSVGVSAISAWELGLLGRRNKLPAAVSPYVLFDRFAEAEGMQVESLAPSILVDSSFLPGDFHNDPADRIIIATARAREMTIVTRDRAILRYADQGHVRALAC